VREGTFDAALTSARRGFVRIDFENSFLGRYEDRLELVFEDTQLKKRFMISRPLQVVVGSKAEHEALRPRIPYAPRPRTARDAVTTTVKGVAPPATNAIPYVGALPRALPPAQLLAVLNRSEPAKKQVDHVKRVHLPQELSSSTYARNFKTLLWVEEHKAEYVSCVQHSIMAADIATELTSNGTTCRPWLWRSSIVTISKYPRFASIPALTDLQPWYPWLSGEASQCLSR
jgi:hypothetical protein